MAFDMLRNQPFPFDMALGIPAVMIAFLGYVLPVGQVSYWLSSKIYGE